MNAVVALSKCSKTNKMYQINQIPEKQKKIGSSIDKANKLQKTKEKSRTQ